MDKHKPKPLEKPESIKIGALAENTVADDDSISLKNKPKNRGKKRKRQDSDSSTDIEDSLPDNTLEVEKNLHASAIKNNLDDVSVKKILKKVVTNDHVLALVKLRAEEDNSCSDEHNMTPKLTRAKAKELMKVSTKPGAWNLENIELTPIKHIPVKTRPEVKALIAQELHEDEEDDEYKPTQEDVQSDDDQTLESCSDLESQPRTPATPQATSPRVLRDGPFKVPHAKSVQNKRREGKSNFTALKTKMDISTPVRRKLIIAEEEKATIALRTRSKLSLSATPIEHIESSFVPPDDLPMPVVDDLWNEFLKECLDPASVTRNEDDDEADPEYNVAADPDAHDEDEEALEKSIIKISKKELSDLVTELFNIIPEDTAEAVLSETLATSVLAGHPPPEVSGRWEGKQEPISDDETENKAGRIPFERRNSKNRISIGKSEPDDPDYHDTNKTTDDMVGNNDKGKQKEKQPTKATYETLESTPQCVVNISVEERSSTVNPAPLPQELPPPLLRNLLTKTDHIQIQIEQPVPMLPEQILILQQQLRQHVQLAASNFLQLYVNPVHWSLAPAYKGYLEQLKKMFDSNAKSVVNVCNLEPALELVNSWQNSVSEDTPENKRMVEFIQSEGERSRRRFAQNCMYVGEFPDMFKQVVANSSVFLYPFLLPAMPYRADNTRKFSYRRSEDELITLGLDQFWQYVEDNPLLYKPPARPHPRQRWGLAATSQLVCKHMFPWLSPRWLLGHIHKVRKAKDNPIYKFFEKRVVVPVKHKLLPFNPKLTLYEQPEHELPRIWVRYLAKSSKRFRDHLYKRKNSGLPPAEGVAVKMDGITQVPVKNPLSIDFTKEIISTRANVLPKVLPKPLYDKFDLLIEKEGNVVSEDVATGCNVAGDDIAAECNVETANNAIEGDAVAVGNVAAASYVELDSKTLEENGTLECHLAKDNVTIIDNVAASCNTLAKCTSNCNFQPKSNTLGNIVPAGDVVAARNAIAAGNCTPTVTFAVANNTKFAGKDLVTVNVSKSAKVSVTSGNTVAANAISEINTAVNNAIIQVKPPMQNAFVISSNVFKVVETSTGAFLVPLTIVQTTRTVNSLSDPIIAKIEGKSNTIGCEDLPEESTTSQATNQRNEDMNNHCKCCMLLKKICKEKQTCITDFFKPKTSEIKKCECSNKKYPKISKRLKMLLNNYKSRSWCVHRDLQTKLDIVKKDIKDTDNDSLIEMETDSGYDLDDLAFVTSYQLKVTTRAGIVRNTHLKKHVNNIFANFDPDANDPLWLAEELYKAFEVDLVDLYKEFLGFLTPKQADEIDKFKDYFVHNCVADLVKKIEKEVADKDQGCKILSYLNGMLVDNVSTACEMCSGLLGTLDGLPKLAQHVFSLFPHKANERKKSNDRREKEKTTATSQIEPATDPEPSITEDQEEQELLQANSSLSKCDESQNLMDYEADHSSSGEEDESNQSLIEQPPVRTTTADMNVVKSEETTSRDILDSAELTISKTEVQDYSDTDMSMMIMSEDEPVKSEAPEWKRDEDKLILELLLQSISPEERKDKTILEMVEEKNVYQIILESLTHKSLDDIRQRVMYLLEILVLSEY